MVGVLLVSHSRTLAEGVREIVLQMTSREFPVAVASGVGENREELGTDAVHIAEVLQQMARPEGVLVLMDLGSAVLSAQTALELLDTSSVGTTRLCPAPLVEGALAAAVCAQAGGSLEEVACEAERGAAGKQQQLQVESTAEPHAEPQLLPNPLEPTAELTVTLENLHGLHTRPAAALVQAVSRFECTCEVANLTSGKGPVPARSLTSLALLQGRKGDRLKALCRGSERHAAIEAIRELAAGGFGEKLDAAPAAAPPIAAAASGNARGAAVSDGITVGPLVMLEEAKLEDNRPTGTAAEELAKLAAALKSVSAAIRRDHVGGSESAKAAGAILNAQTLFLSDPVVMERLRSVLESDWLSASAAWIRVTNELSGQYEAMDDPYFRERSADVRDLARRVLRQLAGDRARNLIAFPKPSILFVDELFPSEADACDPATVLGVIAAQGSATSHAALILRTLGIPCVAGMTGITAADVGKVVAMNGSTGEVWRDPDLPTLAQLNRRQELQASESARIALGHSKPAITLDGARMQVLANVGKPKDAVAAANNGAEGMGLLRTEFLFASRSVAPGEDEQVDALREVYAPLAGPVVVRTLDLGADKPLPFLSQHEEHNPHLGLRGIRLSLQSPELFVRQLRAILRSGTGRDLWVMFPMISLVEEVQQTLALLQAAHEQLQRKQIPHAWPVRRGAMIEVPSAALLAQELSEVLDFFSIGTNDLTQYTMAAERGNASLMHLQDALHPAVLQLITTVVDAAAKRERHVAVCGDAASDPAAAAIFAGLGVRSLSVRPKQIAVIKELFRHVRLSELSALARQALSCDSAAAVRNLVGRQLERSVPSQHGFPDAPRSQPQEIRS